MDRCVLKPEPIPSTNLRENSAGIFQMSTDPVMVYTRCVCPAWASGIEDTKLFQRVKSLCRVLSVSLMCGSSRLNTGQAVPRSISKSQCLPCFSQGWFVVRHALKPQDMLKSETANPGSNEQSLSRPNGKLDTEA